MQRQRKLVTQPYILLHQLVSLKWIKGNGEDGMSFESESLNLGLSEI